MTLPFSVTSSAFRRKNIISFGVSPAIPGWAAKSSTSANFENVEDSIKNNSKRNITSMRDVSPSRFVVLWSLAFIA
jgi:hypothetical protein